MKQCGDKSKKTKEEEEGKEEVKKERLTYNDIKQQKP